MHYKREEAFRYTFTQPVSGLAFHEESEEITVQIIDVSPSGMKINSIHPISENTAINIKYKLIEEEFKVIGKIVWSLDYGDYIQCGISLKHSEEYHHRIITVLKELAKVKG
ncbi:PilZ domain-containing protein [Gracilibacillus ureilyticus]|uniref:PilZ domain-containing protein n=1 Tax=Gracilibacillus ureilyticus TaxID=531814 RepID=A0A1H9TMH0_9BACI|nr:PilZ domain-containing protein [Gracilibacillus ureilyticus]SER98139.1 PilZ domain-containing protein [Gracilibacillus ureilyticus]